MSGVRRVLVVTNPRASRAGRSLEDALLHLREVGIDVVERPLAQPSELTEAIRERPEGVDCLVIGGGDGTLNHALAPVLESGLPLGVLPLGTANDLARTLGIPTDPVEACMTIAAGTQRRIDVGWANDRPFLNSVGIGLSATIASRLTLGKKKRLGAFSYPATVIETLRAGRPFVARVWCGGAVTTLRSIQLTIGNGRYYGGGAPLAEDAAIDDGRLDVFSVRPQSLLSLARLAIAIREGTHSNWEHVDTLCGTEMSIETAPSKRASTDGEVTLRTPLEVRVQSAALTVFAPPEERPDSLGFVNGRATAA